MSFTSPFATTASAVVALDIVDAAALASLADDALLAAHAVVTEHRRAADVLAAQFAAEIARRSSREDGYAGLAQRHGFGSAEAMIQNLSPVTRAEAVQLVQAGELMATAPATLWEGALADALSTGALSIAAADTIRRGLAPVADSAPAQELVGEAERLIARAPLVSIDELRRESRSARDRIDEAGIARREKQRRDLRYLKRWIRDDGMYQGSFLLDPEAGLHVFAALDAIIAPRRAVRFVDETAQDDAALDASAILADERTDDQFLADGLVEMARLAVNADPGTLFGSRRPAVRVVVTEDTLAGPGGHGYFEGDPQPVSRETIDRHLCDTGMMGVKFDRNGKILDLGRTQRLHNAPQRVAIAVRDGGCIFLRCTKPPSACEVHHIVPWKEGGRTTTDDGVLLCQHHHLLVHNNHWRILRGRDEHGRAQYSLKSPVSRDPEQKLIPLLSKSPLMRELARVEYNRLAPPHSGTSVTR